MTANGVLFLQTRQVIGKKVARLRRQGIVPANICGRRLPSVAVQAPLAELRAAFRDRGRNAVVEVQVQGEDGTRPVLLREVQRNPVTDEVQHVEFYQVDLTRRVHAQVEVTLIGDSEAVHLGGVLVHPQTTVEVEALPGEIPDRFEVDISSLTSFGDAIHVGELSVPAGVRILTDAGTVIVAAQAPRVQEEEEAPSEEDGDVGLAEGGEAAEDASRVGAEPATPPGGEDERD